MEWGDTSNTLDAISPSYGRTPGGLASQLVRQGVAEDTIDIRIENTSRGGVFGSELRAEGMERSDSETIRRSATKGPSVPAQSPAVSGKKRNVRLVRENKGKPWTTEDCERLLEAWADTNNTVGSLAKTFGRTYKSLFSRLSKIGDAPTRAAIKAENKRRCQAKSADDSPS